MGTSRTRSQIMQQVSVMFLPKITSPGRPLFLARKTNIGYKGRVLSKHSQIAPTSSIKKSSATTNRQITRLQTTGSTSIVPTCQQEGSTNLEPLPAVEARHARQP